jgi:glycosyltransferase involved in cell wall biosynthesis
MKVPLSVVMSVYNGAATVREAVESVLAQTFREFEFIIIDDGSTDATPDVLASFDDPRVRVIRQRNAGLTVSLNRAVREAAGPLIARMDADDVSLPKRFALQVRPFRQHEDLVLVGSDAEIIDRSGRVIGHERHLIHDPEIRRVYPVGNQFVHGSAMFRRTAFDRVGGYDETIRYSQDFDLWWRLLKRGKGANIPESLYRLRDSPGRISEHLSDEQGRCRDRIIRRMWEEILAPDTGFPPVRGRTWSVPIERDDPYGAERRSFYARLGLRMGIGFVLHGDFPRARAYFRESVRAGPRVREAWACWLASYLAPCRLRRRCEARAEQYPLYAVIGSVRRDG